MPFDTFIALALYAFVASVTPGPNNVMLLASGVNFGFRRTIPHMLGISAGFASLLAAVGLGVGALLAAFPMLHTALKVGGGAYLLYLAWRIGRSRSIGAGGEGSDRPMRFAEAAAFQWVNPKAWVMAVTAMAIYTNLDRPVLSAAIVVIAFTMVNLPSVSSWAAFGVALRGFLESPRRLRWFNVFAGILLAATVWPTIH